MQLTGADDCGVFLSSLRRHRDKRSDRPELVKALCASRKPKGNLRDGYVERRHTGCAFGLIRSALSKVFLR
jgi:hypothetical protein